MKFIKKTVAFMVLMSSVSLYAVADNTQQCLKYWNEQKEIDLKSSGLKLFIPKMGIVENPKY
ncbi:hypothetical protein D7V20_09325 [Acinetobacter rongchengensis]|uniref:Uncharacterized protein n=1 Tax=Acinetobacter rongchengensis TaxID=2419601 RepID=A0A3A8F4F0_9GAMM|nr:hypothetical protein D7V20_09325 [Acinetobacter rongchengensis]